MFLLEPGGRQDPISLSHLETAVDAVAPHADKFGEVVDLDLVPKTAQEHHSSLAAKAQMLRKAFQLGVECRPGRVSRQRVHEVPVFGGGFALPCCFKGGMFFRAQHRLARRCRRDPKRRSDVREQRARASRLPRWRAVDMAELS